MTTSELTLLNGPLYQECIGLAITLTKEKNVARDLVQEAYYLANKRHETFAEGSNLSSWIKTIVYNVFVSDYRKTMRRREMISAKPPADSWMYKKSIDNPAEGELGAEDLSRIVEGVPTIYRQCFLRFVNGMTYAQIANSMNLPVGTVKSRVFTARQLMKEHLLKAQLIAA